MKRLTRAGLLLAGVSLLSACSFAPEHARPAGAVPAALPQDGIYAGATGDAAAMAEIGWRDFFTDADLRAVIETGLANNRDLRVAAANVLQARALYRVQRADRLPGLSASAGATFTDSPTSGATAGTDTQLYSVEAGVSAFELDLFGRVRNMSRAALERYLASEEGARAARISLIGEIANAWLTLASDRDQLALSQAALKTFEQTLDLTRARFRIGVASELDARQAETNYQGARNDVAALQARIAQDRNALELLVGAPVPAERLPARLGAGTATLDALPANLSSDVLLRRPDVLQAEHVLIAAEADIGAARAAFFPRITLTGLVGTMSTALSGLFGSGSFNYTAGPAATLPIFDGGRNAGNLAAARAAREGALASYEKAIQAAFRETADALATAGTIGEQLAAQTARRDAAQVAARLSDARYRAGVDSFLAALDAQRVAYGAEQQLQAARLARAVNRVTLYRALGGGLE